VPRAFSRLLSCPLVILPSNLHDILAFVLHFNMMSNKRNRNIGHQDNSHKRPRVDVKDDDEKSILSTRSTLSTRHVGHVVADSREGQMVVNVDCSSRGVDVHLKNSRIMGRFSIQRRQGKANLCNDIVGVILSFLYEKPTAFCPSYHFLESFLQDLFTGSNEFGTLYVPGSNAFIAPPRGQVETQITNRTRGYRFPHNPPQLDMPDTSYFTSVVLSVSPEEDGGISCSIDSLKFMDFWCRFTIPSDMLPPDFHQHFLPKNAREMHGISAGPVESYTDSVMSCAQNGAMWY
jgi:hypothetical protein